MFVSYWNAILYAHPILSAEVSETESSSASYKSAPSFLAERELVENFIFSMLDNKTGQISRKPAAQLCPLVHEY